SRQQNKPAELATALGLNPATPVTQQLITSAMLQQIAALPPEQAAAAAIALFTELQLAAALPSANVNLCSIVQDVFASLFAAGPDALKGAALDAYNAFNPPLRVQGAMQPQLFGFPIGAAS